MKSVAITGRSSFIGNALRERLEAFPERYRVRMVSLRGEDWRGEGFAGADCVVHAAGIAHIKAKSIPDADYYRVNRDLALEAARRAKADGARQFVLLSSAIVYGEASPAGARRQIGPDTPTAPANAYGRSKLEAEQGLLALADEGFRVAVVRPPMVYGRGCKGNYNQLARLAGALPVFPRFDNARSVLYVENLAECLRLILDAEAGGLFFPQDARQLSTAELVDLVARARGRRVRFLRCLNPAVRLLGRRGIVRRAFGDMAYDSSMSRAPGDYRRFDTQTAIRRTETGRG